MKKYIYFILALTIAGTILSALLLIQHYYPDSSLAAATCGDGITNPCHALSISDYSTVFSVPIAVYGILFYTFILFVVLIADYAKDHYNLIASAAVMILAVLGVITDFVLAAILIVTGLFCHLCAWTYAVNIALLITGFLWLNSQSRNEQISPVALILQSIKKTNKTPGDRAALASFVLFSLLLSFSIISANNILTLQTGKRRISDSQLSQYVKKFYETDIEDIQLPPSSLVLGNPEAPVTITAYTDFLCSACYSLYMTEKYLLTKYPEQIRVIYYNYPLDANCNQEIRKTLYHNSCIASRAAIAAAKMGILHEYLGVHFSNYKTIKQSYSEETALFILRKVSEITGQKYSESMFQEIMQSQETSTILGSDIDFAQKIGISATPTLFLSGRRIRGGPPKEVMNIIIKNELEKYQHDESNKKK